MNSGSPGGIVVLEVIRYLGHVKKCNVMYLYATIIVRNFFLEEPPLGGARPPVPPLPTPLVTDTRTDR